MTGKLPLQDRAFMLIDGTKVHVGADSFVTLNPATESPLANVPIASPEQIDAAIDASLKAQKDWWALKWQERTSCLRGLADQLMSQAEEIVAVECADTGNTIRTLERDIRIAADNLHFFAGAATQLGGHTFPASPENLHISLREPYGVVLRIVPFNHPFMFASARIAAPLAAGNGVVIKTPEQSPLSASFVAEACIQHLPPGLVAILHGDGASVGDPLVRHPKIHRIGFTGSIPTGRLIQRSAAEAGVKHVSLELGGKNPLIALPDIDAERVAEAAVRGMNFAWSGQSCGSTSRLLVHESKYEGTVAAVAQRVDALRLGAPDDPESDMGPMNSAGQLRKTKEYIAAAMEDGARLVAGGGPPEGAQFKAGYWIRPTVFADVTSRMRLGQEEVFGPILSIMRWSTESEAIELANSTQFGLTAAIWTNDHAAALRLARSVTAGYVWVNGGSAHFLGMPFGGAKESGTGSEESLEELQSYTRQRAIHFMSAPPA